MKADLKHLLAKLKSKVCVTVLNHDEAVMKEEFSHLSGLNLFSQLHKKSNDPALITLQYRVKVKIPQ